MSVALTRNHLSILIRVNFLFPYVPVSLCDMIKSRVRVLAQIMELFGTAEHTDVYLLTEHVVMVEMLMKMDFTESRESVLRIRVSPHLL